MKKIEAKFLNKNNKNSKASVHQQGYPPLNQRVGGLEHYPQVGPKGLNAPLV